MIKKFESFRKFSDTEKSTKVKEEVNNTEDTESSVVDIEDLTKPAVGATNSKSKPNVPRKTDKQSKTMDTTNIRPSKTAGSVIAEENPEITNESNVKLYGKVAKFPNNVQASKSVNFLENVKISKNSIWYVLIEKQENELQMVKYNNKKGVDLAKFVNELKAYYINKYSKDKAVSKLIESIQVSGANEFSAIKNIPNVEVDGRKLISKITEDLIKLLSK
jgi:hypothetical protein